jgi:hypothetical protein
MKGNLLVVGRRTEEQMIKLYHSRMEYKKSIREALEYVAEKKAKSKAKFKTTFTPEGDILL